MAVRARTVSQRGLNRARESMGCDPIPPAAFSGMRARSRHLPACTSSTLPFPSLHDESLWLSENGRFDRSLRARMLQAAAVTSGGPRYYERLIEQATVQNWFRLRELHRKPSFCPV